MKYKTVYTKGVKMLGGKPYSYFLWRRKIISHALKTMYLTNDMEQLWDAITILDNEFRKAKRENFTRLCGGKGWK